MCVCILRLEPSVTDKTNNKPEQIGGKTGPDSLRLCFQSKATADSLAMLSSCRWGGYMGRGQWGGGGIEAKKEERGVGRK